MPVRELLSVKSKKIDHEAVIFQNWHNQFNYPLNVRINDRNLSANLLVINAKKLTLNALEKCKRYK